MAKLHNYYVLCPLIDQKSFLGVSPDKEEEIVIVTLGRNVVNRYRLTDEKQVGGWTSRDHITSAVVYDPEQDSYVAVFNNNIIKIWSEDAQNLDKIKKHKFPVHMLKLIPRKQSSLIIFNNGNCASLPYALENRKTYESKSLIKDTDTIVDTACYNQNKVHHVCYIVKSVKETYEIIHCPLREELGDMERSKMNRVQVKRSDDVTVVGSLIALQEKTTAVYILWSDSKLTMYDLTNKSWKAIGNIPWLSTSSGVSMAWMGKNHLILFGSNLEQDGAIVIAYNIVLGIASCKYPMKMYSEGAKLYCFSNRIVLEASNHIAVIPYLIETKRNLSSLLGSHQIAEDETMQLVHWDSDNTLSLNIPNEIKELANVGLTERTICTQIALPLLQKLDFKKLLKAMIPFKDIPESIQVQFISCSLKFINPVKIEVTNHEEFIDFCDQNKENFKLINFTFNLTFSDALIIPHLRTSLVLKDVLFLMRYITYLLNSSEMEISCDYESKLLDWCTLLMDAFYPQFLLTKDQSVTDVLDIATETVTTLIDYMFRIDETMTKINRLLNGKGTKSEESSTYFIETMSI